MNELAELNDWEIVQQEKSDTAFKSWFKGFLGDSLKNEPQESEN